MQPLNRLLCLLVPLVLLAVPQLAGSATGQSAAWQSTAQLSLQKARSKVDPEKRQLADKRCMACHGREHIGELSPGDRASMVGTWLGPDAAYDPPVKGKEPTQPDSKPQPGAAAKRPELFVRHSSLTKSVHEDLACIDCHEDSERLPHAQKLNLATCATRCHEDEAKAYDGGEHGKALREGKENVPSCSSCHGSHDIHPIEAKDSKLRRLTRARLCGDCHEKHKPENGSKIDPRKHTLAYLESTHGRAVAGSGLKYAATCTDCHGAHEVLHSKNPDSPVHRDHIAATCGRCHEGVVETFAKSSHGKLLAEKDDRGPVCTDCHTGHKITRTESPGFLHDVLEDCGDCHNDPKRTKAELHTRYATYRKSYHGQVTELGATRAASCSSCHGAHDMLPADDPHSRVHKDRLVQTCGTAACHPGANANFVKFDPHADYYDGERYPLLHGVWLYFMIVMSLCFGIFGLHTLLWFLRSMIERRRGAMMIKHRPGKTAIRRFTRLQRINHVLVAVPFLGLTLTGVPLLFSDEAWAQTIASFFGGIMLAGVWHRFFAFFLMINFAIHGFGIIRAFRSQKQGLLAWIFGPTSMLPKWKDVQDFFGMFRWFLRGGRMPRFDRWTYFEKFDYWCEIGGSVIIGSTGLLLWFPLAASTLFPGWIFNVATIAHGYEALLAIGFIFTIHFFNANLRVGKFPVDTVIFSGRMPEEELKEERPAEYERLVETGELETLRVPEWPAWKYRLATALGVIAMLGAMALLVLIILAGLGEL